jgi:hypothetical protein
MFKAWEDEISTEFTFGIDLLGICPTFISAGFFGFKLYAIFYCFFTFWIIARGFP